MKKRLLAVALVALFFVPLVGTLLFYHYRVWEIRKHVKQHLIAVTSTDELVLIKLTRPEAQTLLRWEHPAEFEYQGQMYDVVKKESRDDTLYFWCWWDYEETSLNKQLTHLVAMAMGSDHTSRQYQNMLEKFFNSLFAGYEPFYTLALQVCGTNHLVCPVFACLGAAYPPPYPPPEVG
jgi:hypothetical protein